MDDYFSQFLKERKEKEKLEQSLKIYVVTTLVLFILLVIMTIRCVVLIGNYEDLMREYEDFKIEYNVEAE